MLPGLTFWFWRSCEVLTLIPTLGMLAWFVHGYTEYNQLTPSPVLVLFIVSVLACFWAVATLLAYHGMTRWNAHFCALVDLCFVGALIAGVYYLRDIKNWNCAHFGQGASPHGIYAQLGIFGYSGHKAGIKWGADLNKNCAMLKASWVFGIMNTIFFFITFVSFPLDSKPPLIQIAGPSLGCKRIPSRCWCSHYTNSQENQKNFKQQT
jgi:hypothetical protein